MTWSGLLTAPFDLGGARAYADAVLTSGRGIDLFIGSAGVMANPAGTRRPRRGTAVRESGEAG
ncbi:hypothetical protein AB0K15_33900 [Amycolatopsis sp. NPDC049253]|uniref:hypothetical protein n=1 Tax=Amycolatopsis sp. NPDC049253 TaxID=3155274 RepID=UPI00344757BF